MARRYHTLAIREDGRWAPQFGDYDKDAVLQEREDSYGETKRRDWRVITTGDKKADIDAAIAALNAGGAR